MERRGDEPRCHAGVVAGERHDARRRAGNEEQKRIKRNNAVFHSCFRFSFSPAVHKLQSRFLCCAGFQRTRLMQFPWGPASNFNYCLVIVIHLSSLLRVISGRGLFGIHCQVFFKERNRPSRFSSFLLVWHDRNIMSCDMNFHHCKAKRGKCRARRKQNERASIKSAHDFYVP